MCVSTTLHPMYVLRMHAYTHMGPHVLTAAGQERRLVHILDQHTLLMKSTGGVYTSVFYQCCINFYWALALLCRAWCICARLRGMLGTDHETAQVWSCKACQS